MSAFSNAQQEWEESHRPFQRPRGTKPTHAPFVRKETPDPADYDPRYRERQRTNFDGTPKQVPALQDQIQAELTEAFNREHYRLNDLTPQRIKVTYRTLRSMAMAFGMIRAGESLTEATELSTYDPSGNVIDPWSLKRPLPNDLPLASMVRARDNPDLDLADYRHVTFLAELKNDRPNVSISLLPPPIPARWIYKKSGRLNDAYDPADPTHDQDMVIYYAAFRGIYDQLGIRRGSARDPHFGINGLAGLDDIYTFRQAFPTRAELLAHEGIIIHDTLRWLIEKGVMETMYELEAEYGMTKRECHWTLTMARTHATSVTSTDVDSEKCLMILRLEDLIRRAKGMFDMKRESDALKQLANVLGITRSEPANFETEARTFIRDWSSKSSETLARAAVPSHINLPAPAEKPQA